MLGAPVSGGRRRGPQHGHRPGKTVRQDGRSSKILRIAPAIVKSIDPAPLPQSKGGGPGFYGMARVSLPERLNISSSTRSVGLAGPPIRRMASVSRPSRPSNRPRSVSDTVVALSIEGVLAPGAADR